MKTIENVKVYTGNNLSNLLLPVLKRFSIRTMLNMPIPTILNIWERDNGIANKYSKEILLFKVILQSRTDANDYFNLIWENISADKSIDLSDLSSDELEKAEVGLLQDMIYHKLNYQMWNGGHYIEGLIPKMIDKNIGEQYQSEDIINILELSYLHRIETLMADKVSGNIVFYVSPDIYKKYDIYLSNLERFSDSRELYYKGIKLECINSIYSFVLLTDKRNLVLSINTMDIPGCEARLWYNPDMQENRQRVVFDVGCDYILPELISFQYRKFN